MIEHILALQNSTEELQLFPFGELAGKLAAFNSSLEEISCLNEVMGMIIDINNTIVHVSAAL